MLFSTAAKIFGERVNTILGTALLASVTYLACMTIIEASVKTDAELIVMTSEMQYMRLYPER